jgi:hypothetical protein
VKSAFALNGKEKIAGVNHCLILIESIYLRAQGWPTATYIDPRAPPQPLSRHRTPFQTDAP